MIKNILYLFYNFKYFMLKKYFLFYNFMNFFVVFEIIVDT